MQDKLPERISPIPTVVPDCLMRIDLDKDVGNNQSPAKDPTSDNGEDGFICRESELCTGEQGIGQEVAVGLPELSQA